MPLDRVSLAMGIGLACLGLKAAELRAFDGQSPAGRVTVVADSTQGAVRDPQGPARDRPPAAPVGRAMVRGRIVDGQTGAAIARARVRLGGQGAPRPPVLSDSQGAFAFTGLPAGVYSLTADKATYLSGSYPDRRPSLRASVARALILRDDEVVDNLTVPLYHGSAISGRVLDEHGDPVEFAQVFALPARSAGAGSGPRYGGQSNDIGEFRIGRLAPGRYVLMATVNQRMLDGPMIEAAPLPQPVPSYYPSVLSRSEAQPIALGRGQTASGIDLVMLEGVPTVVTGRVIATDGQPAASANGGWVNARLDEPGAQWNGGPSGQSVLRPDGSFRLVLAPGNYFFEASRPLPAVEGSRPGRPNEQFGMAKVSVAGESMAVSIVIGGGATAAGRVIFEGDTQPPAPPAQAGVPFGPQDGGYCRSGQLQIAPDWSFKIDGMMGTCSPPPYASFGRWTLKSVSFDNQELKGGSVTFEAGQHYGDVQIVVTDRRNELTLHVTDAQGQPTRDYVVLVFSSDKSRWSGSFPAVRTFVPPSLAMVAALQRAPINAPAAPGGPPRQPGREVIPGLVPGDYYAIALDDIDQEASNDPDTLERLAPSAVRLTVVEGAADVALPRLRLADVIR